MIFHRGCGCMLNKNGVTLVELLIVIVILGIISAISFVAVGRIIENTRWRSVEANLSRLEDAIRLYRISGGPFVEDDETLMANHFDEAEIPNRTNPKYWEMFSILVLGDYVQGWPDMPNGGVFAYRYRDEIHMENTSNRLSTITLNHLEDPNLAYDETLRDVFFNGEIPNQGGHFLKIRFDGDSQGTQDFEETVRFLLEKTDYQTIFRWVLPNGTPQNNIWIYLP